MHVDRKMFIEKLERVRQIRDNVMHLDPDGLPESELQELREFSRTLQVVLEARAGGR